MPIDSSGNYWIARDSSGTYSADYYMALAENNASTIASYNNTVNSLVTAVTQTIKDSGPFYPVYSYSFSPFDQYAEHSQATLDAITALALSGINDFVESVKRFTEVYDDDIANTNVLAASTAISTFQVDFSGNLVLSPYYLYQGSVPAPQAGVTNSQFLSDANNLRFAFINTNTSGGEYDADLQNFINKAKAMKVAFDAFKTAVLAEPTTETGMSSPENPTYYTGLNDFTLNSYYIFFNELLNNTLSFDSSNNQIIYNKLSFDSSNNLIIPDFPSTLLTELVSSVGTAKTIIEEAPQAPPPPTFVSQITDSSGVTRIKFRGDTRQVPQAPFVQAHFVYDSSGILPNYPPGTPDVSNFDSSYRFVDIFNASYVADTTKIFNYPNNGMGINVGVNVDASGICFAEFIFGNPITRADPYTISWYLTNGNDSGEGTPSAPASFTLTPTGSPPGTPNAPTLVSKTGTTITVRTSTTGVSGNPPNAFRFRATDSSNNTFDSSGNESPDASGNYTGTISGLTAGRSYNITATLYNEYGDSTSSATQIATGSPPGTPPAPTFITKSPSTITVKASTTGVSGGPFTAYRFTATDSSNNSYDFTGYNQPPDSSGNYNTTITALTSNIVYNVSFTLFNEYGDTTSSSIQIRTAISVEGLEAPTLVSATGTSLVVRVSTTELEADRPLTGYLFIATDSSGISYQSSGSGPPDSSGNYTATINGLTANTFYNITVTIINEYSSISATANNIQTSEGGSPPGNASAPTLVSSTSTTLTVSSSGVSGEPFSVINFKATDSSGFRIATITNGIDGAGFYVADASGNYNGIFTDLTPNTSYSVTVQYTNDYAEGEESAALTASTTSPDPDPEPTGPGSPGTPILLSATPNSVTLRVDTNGVSGGPFTGYIFKAIDTLNIDSSGNKNLDASGNYSSSANVAPDGSGNYTATITGLSSTRFYETYAILKNSDGDGGDGTPITISALGTPGTPPAPILGASDSNSLFVVVNLQETLGGYFDTRRFTITDSSGYSYFQNVTGNQSFVYATNFIGLPPSTSYQITFTISNSFGTRTSATLTASTTSIPSYSANIETIVSQRIATLNTYSTRLTGISNTVDLYYTLANNPPAVNINAVRGQNNDIEHSSAVKNAFNTLNGSILDSFSILNNLFQVLTRYPTTITEFIAELSALPSLQSNIPNTFATALYQLNTEYTDFASNLSGASSSVSNWSVTALQTALNNDSAWIQANGGSQDPDLLSYVSQVSSVLTNTFPTNTVDVSQIYNEFNFGGTAFGFLETAPRAPTAPSLISITTNGTSIFLTVKGNRNSILEGYFNGVVYNLTTLGGTSYPDALITIPKDAGLTPDSSGNFISEFIFTPGTSVFNAGDLVSITWGAKNFNNNLDSSENYIYNTSDPLLVVLRPPQPSKASGDSTLNAPTLVSATSNTLTLRNNATGIRGVPLSDVNFTALDSSGNLRRANTSNSQDGSGNYVADSSGNYTATITGLSTATVYNLRTILNNGFSPSTSEPLTASTTSPPPGTPNAPTQVSVTTTSITVRSSTTGISGSPFNAFRFRATDSSNNTFDSSGNGSPDASGNYTGTISGLTAGRVYSVTTTLFNTSGNSTGSATQITTGIGPGTPNAPTLVSKTPVSLTVRASTTGVSGGPFTAYRFRATDSTDNSTYDSSGNGSPDSSGNYMATITGLENNTEYNVTITLFNVYGDSTSSTTQIRTPLQFGDLEGPTLVSATSNSLVVRVSTTNLDGERPLTGYLFIATDDNSNTFDSSGNGPPDSSGNYTATITGLTANTFYDITVTVYNEYTSTSAISNDIQTSANPPPGTPNAPTVVSATSTTLSVRSNVNGVSGGPFSEILFSATDSSGTSFSNYTTNGRDASGNFAADSSGNFSSIISGLTPSRSYSVKLTLTNTSGSTTSTSTTASTANGFPGTPPAPTLVSVTSDSLSLRVNGTGVSGGPFNLITFTATDSSGTVSLNVSSNEVDASGNYLTDASGNYSGTVGVATDSSGTSLDNFRNTNYSVRVIFSNIYGSTTSSPLSATTSINQVEFGISNSHINASRYLYVFISLANTRGSPFTSCDFNFTDSSNNTTIYRYTGEEIVGSKANYYALITTNNKRISGLQIYPNKTYSVNATLYNNAGSVSGTQYSTITTLLENVEAILISKTSSSIVVSGDLGMLTDGNRLDVNKDITDVLINYMDGSGNNLLDASGNPLNTTVSGPDASGNYTGTMTGLTGNTQYSIYFSFFYDSNFYSSVPVKVTTNSAGPPPGTPVAPTVVSATSTTLSVRSNVNGVSGGPFSGVSFTATDSSGNTLSQNATNNQDATGNYIADSSGNYVTTINGLTPNTTYSIRLTLTNENGSTTSASSIIPPVPGNPNAPTLISATGTTITLRTNVNGVSGAPFTQGTFTLDRYVNGSLTTLYLSDNTLDSSGNYTVTFTDLPYSTTFDALVYLNNNTGTGDFSQALTVSTIAQSPPGQANTPVLAQSLSFTSIVISTNTSGVSGEPFTQVEFTIRDSSGTLINTTAVSGEPDSSGNYSQTISGLTQTSLYYITAKLTNGGGTGVESSSLSVVTQGPPASKPGTPIFISKTATSITVFSSTEGILGSPFTGGNFMAVDSNSNTFTGNLSNSRDSSGNYLVDSSGNYTGTITGLSSNTLYNITFDLRNTYGFGPAASSQLNITTGELPGTPNSPTEISVTTTSITVRTSTTGITGGPFTGYLFRATDSSGIFYDSSGNGPPDASGNYNDTISGLNSSSLYNITSTLFNTYGAGPTSVSTPITTSVAAGPPPGTANPPTLVSKTATSITMTGNPTGISGTPFTGARFNVIDSSGTTVGTTNPTTVDASGNYTSTFNGLIPNTSYSVTFALSNSNGNGQASSASVVTTGALPGTPNAPTLVSKTLNSLTVITSTTGITGGPFTSYRFRATDTNNNTFDSSGNGAPDSSGNYSDIISGLSAGTIYTVTATLFNEYGDTSSAGTSIPTGAVPGTPNTPTLVSKTLNSLTLRTSTTGITGEPFTSYRFRAIDSSNNTFDSSGNGPPDASGNYSDIISGLTSGRLYTVTATLFNAYGNTTSAGTSITTGSVPGTPNAPTQVSVTTSSVTIRTSTTGIVGSPFTSYRFRATDSSNNTFDSSGNGPPDASGNYTDTISGLSAGRQYTVTATLFNAYGNTTSGGTSITTGSVPGTANAPTQVSVTTTSVTVRTSTTGLSGSPFTSYRFRATDSSNNTFDSSGNGSPDASGNYSDIISGLTSGRLYIVTATLFNAYGNTTSAGTSITTGAVPGTPNAPTQVSVTTSSITVRTSTTGITGSPFTSYRFRATDSSNNTFDSSGNGSPDASGNYSDIISGLTSGRQYTVTATLFNEYGNTSSAGTSITTGSVPGTPNAPTQVSVTTSSITVRTSTTGITGSPFTSYRFRATDSSNNTFDSSGNGSPDASGNYSDIISGLTSGRQYTVTATLFNEYGNTSSAGTSITTGAVPGTANAPTQVSVTTTSVTVRTSTTGLTGGPFTSYRFRATDSSNNTFDSSGNGSPDASGNYTDTISGLNSSTLYNITATVFNVYGPSSTSTSTPITTSTAVGPPPGTANPPTVVSKTATTITMAANPTGISGAPFTAGLFTVKTTGGTTVTTANPTTTDASGNYNATLTGLTQNTTYNITFKLSNSSGNGPESSATSVTTEAIPGTPNAPTQLSVTTSSVTIRTSTTGIAGSPFTSYRFRATDSSNNTFDSSGNEPPDASGNYTDTISGLTSGRLYTVTATLFNAYGNTTSGGTSITTGSVPGTPNAPTQVSVTTTSVTVRTSTTGLAGSPFTSYRFRAIDSSNNTFDSSGNGSPDASGNYSDIISGLTSGRLYTVTATLFNVYGNTTSGGTSITTGSVPGTANAPTQVSVTTSSVTVRTSTTGLAGSPFTSYRFRATDSSNNTFDSSGNGSPDASGNYNDTISGLNSSTLYNITATVFNIYGAGATSTSTPITTSTAVGPSPGTANAPTLVSKTTTTITMTSNPVGISGTPFTGGLFTVKTTGGTTVATASPTTVDASGNYTSTLTGLSQNTSYNVTFTLSNSNGTGPTSSATSVTTGALPGTPNAPTQISVTTTSITVRTSTTGLAGSPFTSYRFRATDTSNNTFDSTGNGAPDSSGNYNDTISGLTQGKLYSVTATLFNIYGNTTSPASQIATTTPPPGTPSAPTLIANGSTYVKLRENVSGLSGSPFTECVFNFADSSNNSVTSFSLQGPPDSSGNYNITTDNTLTPLTYYRVTATVTNAGGSATSTNDIQFTTLNEGSASSLVSKTTNSIILVNNLQTDSSGTSISGPYSNVSINYQLATSLFQFSISTFSMASGTVSGPDGSGNYTGTITGLSSNTAYNVFFSFTTSNGNLYTTIPLSVTTNSNPICFKTGSKILCLKDNKEQYIPVEQLRKGDLVRTLSGEYIKINLIGKSTINNPDNNDRGPNRLFILRKSNYPELNEDLIITGCHSRLVDKLTPEQKKRHLQLMANLYITTGKFRLMAFIDEKAEPYRDPGVHDIWHFALDNENEVCNYGVYANGLLVETASIKNMGKIVGINLL